MMGVGPAYQALVVEAQVDAAVRHGLAPRARRPARGRDDGRHARRCSAHREYDTLAVRREVTSPGGTTARGLDGARARRRAEPRSRTAIDAVIRSGER